MATTYLTRTFGTPTSRTTGTFSFWMKVSTPIGGIINNYTDNSTRSVLYFGSDYLRFYDSTTSTEYNADIAKIRDCNGWYHVVLQISTPDGTQQDRVRIYINGVRQSPLIGSPNYSQNQNSYMFNPGSSFFIGRDTYTGSHSYFNGSISHLHYCDGQAYDASSFGETDATTGEWKIKTSPSVTYGSQGFFILKDGNSLTDSSPNSNNFTVAGGTLTKTEDNPSNVFATMNALSKGSSATLSKGNTIIRNDTGNDANVLGTIALGNGKYYWETYKHGGGNTGLGLTLASVDGGNHSTVHSYRVNYYADGNIYQNGFGLSDINTGVTYADTDIIGVSVDTENGTIKFYKNGVLVNNSSQTNSAFTYAQNELIPFWYAMNGGEWRTNFGNGYFGTTAVSSAGTNASGNGIFEYDIQPTDATALSTKGLNL